MPGQQGLYNNLFRYLMPGKKIKSFLLQDICHFLYNSEILYRALNVLESNLIMSIR